MNNSNPAEMSNQDLEDDMQQRNETDNNNQENVQTSTATEGELINPSDDPAEAQQVDASGFIVDEASQDGSAPDPEALESWESNDEDMNKISG